MENEMTFVPRKSRRKRMDAFQAVALVICILAAFICLYPMYYVLIMSVSDPHEAAAGVYLLPRGLYFGSYELIFKNKDVWNGLKMSLLYVVTGTLGMLITCVMAAYPLTRPGLWFRKAVVIYLLIPMYFSGGMIPAYMNMSSLNLYNTVWAIILPSCFSIWNIILVRTYFMSIPEDLQGAAFIDGANHIQVLTRIYVPLSKPVLAVVAIYTIVGIWNSWFSAMIYLPNYKLHPVQMYLQRVLITQSVDLVDASNLTMEEAESLATAALTARQLKYAVIIVVSAPIILVYPLFQKHFVKGVMLGSLKG